MLNLPTPSADPVVMVAELFEKLKLSESRGAAARAQLAQMQHELAALRATKAEPERAEPGEMVMLEIRFLELDLDGIAAGERDAADEVVGGIQPQPAAPRTLDPERR